MGTTALVGLGSNLGDRKARLDAAIRALAETTGVAVLAVSSYHETAPVGGPTGQGAFLNASARLETSLDPLALLRVLHRIERAAGRVRAVRWGARSLDLDLLIFGSETLDTPELIVPHPRLALRRFVLATTAEVAPEVIEPITGRSIADLLANLDRRPSRLAIDGEGPLLESVLAGVVAGLGASWIVSDLRTAVGPIAPTFVARLGRAAVRPAPTGCPILRPEATEPSAIVAEILATCAGMGGRPAESGPI